MSLDLLAHFLNQQEAGWIRGISVRTHVVPCTTSVFPDPVLGKHRVWPVGADRAQHVELKIGRYAVVVRAPKARLGTPKGELDPHARNLGRVLGRQAQDVPTTLNKIPHGARLLHEVWASREHLLHVQVWVDMVSCHCWKPLAPLPQDLLHTLGFVHVPR